MHFVSFLHIRQDIAYLRCGKQKKIGILHRVVDPDPEPDPDPYWIRIQLGLWIRIRIRNPDPDPGGQK